MIQATSVQLDVQRPAKLLSAGGNDVLVLEQGLGVQGLEEHVVTCVGPDAVTLWRVAFPATASVNLPGGSVMPVGGTEASVFGNVVFVAGGFERRTVDLASGRALGSWNESYAAVGLSLAGNSVFVSEISDSGAGSVSTRTLDNPETVVNRLGLPGMAETRSNVASYFYPPERGYGDAGFTDLGRSLTWRGHRQLVLDWTLDAQRIFVLVQSQDSFSVSLCAVDRSTMSVTAEIGLFDPKYLIGGDVDTAGLVSLYRGQPVVAIAGGLGVWDLQDDEFVVLSEQLFGGGEGLGHVSLSESRATLFGLGNSHMFAYKDGTVVQTQIDAARAALTPVDDGVAFVQRNQLWRITLDPR